MNKLTKLFLTLTVCLAVFCCKTQKFGASNPNLTDNVIEGSYTGTYTSAQFDSICNADNIDKDLSKWHNFYFIDFEDGDTIFEYVYLVEIQGGSTVYIVKEQGKKLVITKRTVINDD